MGSEGPVVEPRPVAYALTGGVQRDRRDDDDVELVRAGARIRRSAKAEGMILHAAWVAHEAEDHLTGLQHRRVRHPHGSRPQARVERAEIHLVLLFDGPEERDRTGHTDRLESREVLDDSRRALRAGRARRRLSESPEALSNLGLDAKSEDVVRRQRSADM